MPHHAVIEMSDAVALVGRFPVLAGFDLSVDAGELVHLAGANGAGKTSVLRTCAGLVAVRGGAVTVLGHDLRVDRRAVRRSVGLLAHATGLYDQLTALDNVRFWADACRVPNADAPAALARVGLEQRLAEVAVERMSAGQRRRVSLAAMIVRRPRLWLLDEPHAGLDAAGRDLVDALMSEATAAGATVLFASHDHDRASSVATRTVTVVGGVVAEDTRAA